MRFMVHNGEAPYPQTDPFPSAFTGPLLKRIALLATRILPTKDLSDLSISMVIFL